MNFLSNPAFKPLKVVVINIPLSGTARLTITKILSGSVFGMHQLIDLVLLIDDVSHKTVGEDLKLEMHSCGFSCMNSITVSIDLPNIADADVFCFITSLQNPNSVDFSNINNEEFDALCFITKVAKSLFIQPKSGTEDEKNVIEKKFGEEKSLKPIVMTDGVETLNILRYFAKDLPADIFFCPTPLPAIAKKILGEKLKVFTDTINEIHVWGADDSVFHIEVEKPLVLGDHIDLERKCNTEIVGKYITEAASLVNTTINDAWMKKDFIDKVRVMSSKNPYGAIYRAAEFAKTLNLVWRTRAADAGKDLKVHTNIGVISDGSLGTVKGCGYVLPVVFSGDTWSVDSRCAETLHVQQEIKRINKSVIKAKDKLVPYCKKVLAENTTKQVLMPRFESRDSPCCCQLYRNYLTS